MSFNAEDRKLYNWADGFAKLHSLKFDGNNVYYSGKMIESTTYMDSKNRRKLVPQFTLSPFEDPKDEWKKSKKDEW